MMSCHYHNYSNSFIPRNHVYFKHTFHMLCIVTIHTYRGFLTLLSFLQVHIVGFCQLFILWDSVLYRMLSRRIFLMGNLSCWILSCGILSGYRIDHLHPSLECKSSRRYEPHTVPVAFPDSFPYVSSTSREPPIPTSPVVP